MIFSRFFSSGHRAATSGADWAGLAWLFLFFWFFSGLTQTLVWLSGASIFVGFRDSLFVSLIWLVPVLLLPNLTRHFTAVVGLLLWVTSLVSLIYFGIYRQEFSQSVIFVILETNPAEAVEYLDQYFSWHLLGGLLLYSLIALGLWTRLRPVRLSRRGKIIALCFCLYASLGYTLLRHPGEFDRVQKRFSAAVPWQLVVGYTQYRQQLAAMQAQLAANTALPPLANLEDTSGDAPRTLVLVIGESTSRQHMSLYGYPRPTTPELEKLRASGKLTVFSDVIAPRPYTIEVLREALTFADQQHPELALTRPTLVNLMKQAGYKTFWITNQQTMTQRNTLLTTFSQQADEAVYLNNSRFQNSISHDGIVRAPFRKALADAAPKKFIVIHLLGTHMKYRFRYPDTYAYFTGTDAMPPNLSPEQIETRNSYDNAVRYHDAVLARLIQDFDAQGDTGFLLYFADHGEEVFDTPPYQTIGRNEGTPTRPMYEIPFFLWTSSHWQRLFPRDFSTLTARPYSTEHLIHTFSDLAGLRYDGYRPKASLVHPAFRPVPRLIGNPEGEQALRDFDATLPR
ncbi:MAG: phosphoethanolamine transferase CptA [Zoogloeaceae bacterium]|jgi:heptose-I-phosphate ethanolaminephosphotransferase|nr:phosphoethanolamine transferase CptA [Zoogloeaceae bacterium]